MADLSHELGCNVSQLIMADGWKSPVGQLSACSTLRALPQVQLEARCRGSHPYLKHSASLKALLCRAKPWALIGRAVSQMDAPLSCERSRLRRAEVESCW